MFIYRYKCSERVKVMFFKAEGLAGWIQNWLTPKKQTTLWEGVMQLPIWRDSINANLQWFFEGFPPCLGWVFKDIIVQLSSFVDIKFCTVSYIYIYTLTEWPDSFRIFHVHEMFFHLRMLERFQKIFQPKHTLRPSGLRRKFENSVRSIRVPAVEMAFSFAEMVAFIATTAM